MQQHALLLVRVCQLDNQLVISVAPAGDKLFRGNAS